MRAIKCLLPVIIVVLLTVGVSAEELVEVQAQEYGVEGLQDGLNKDAKRLMDGYDPLQQINVSEGAFTIIKKAVAESGGTLSYAVKVLIYILLIVIICQLSDALISDKCKRIVSVAGTVAIVAYCGVDIHAMVGLGRETINEIQNFSNILLPVMVSAATTAGSFTGAGAIYTLSTLFSNLLVRLCGQVLVPAVYAHLALAMTDAVLQQERLKRLRDLVGWTIEKGLKAIVYVFTGFLSVTGLLTGVADEAALKAAKMTISGVVPVVGSIISNAASSVLSSAALLKGAVGSFGMLSILALFAAPFIKMGISYLVFRISTAISGIFDSGHSGLLEAISSVMGYMLAMTASCTLICLLSCCFLIKSVQL